ncbi:MAG: hypothetical protein AAGB34_08030 [Planctomycetota bacterium]
MDCRAILVLAAVGLVGSAHANELAVDNFNDRREAMSFRVQPDLALTNGHFPSTFPADFFGLTDRTTAQLNAANHLIDESANDPQDAFGILRSDQREAFFVLADTVNPVNALDPSVAEWTFDISGASGLGVSIRIAAMGEFEGETGPFADRIDWYAIIDGGVPQQLWHMTGDPLREGRYTMESGTVIHIPSPLAAGPTTLTNTPRELVRVLDGTGSTLTIRLEASLDGANEVVVIENLRIQASSISNPATGACCDTSDFSCADGVASGACAGAGFTFWADNTCTAIDCSDQSVDAGACCVDGVCTSDLTESQCSGEFFLNQSCDLVPCAPGTTGDIDESLNGCCIGDQCFSAVNNKRICTDNGGSWLLAGDCETSDPEDLGRSLCDFVSELGACCDIDGCHLDVPRAICEAGGAVFSEVNSCDVPCGAGAGHCEGDANADRLVNVGDFIAVLLNFGRPGPDGDANNDQSVDVGDFISVLLNFGSPC